MRRTRYQLIYPIRRSSNGINDYIYLICLSLDDEELDAYVVYLHITCLFTTQQKENNKKELHKK